MSDTNRTENPPLDPEKKTPAFQHLAPSVLAQHAGKPGEEMVLAFIPREFVITLSDGTRQRVTFAAGNYPIPARFRDHFYLKANGVTFGDEVKVTEKPKLEGGADPQAASAAAAAEAERIAAEKAAAAKAWPADPDKATFKELGDALLAHGVTEDDIKKVYLSTALRAAKAKEMIAAEAGNGA